MAEVQKIKTILNGIENRLAYYKDQIDPNINQFSRGDLESMLERVKQLYTKYDDAFFKLEELDSSQADIVVRNEFENNCRSVESRIRNKIYSLEESKVSSNCIQNTNSLNSIALPELPLPKFSGSFLSWIEFREIFLQRIHNDQRISPIFKFSYLQDCLRGGSAYHFIEGIPNSLNNYNQVWETLFKFYENEPRIKTLHIQLLYDLKPVRREGNATDLQNFIDSFWKQFNALKSLNVPINTWDLILVYHVCRLLDPATRQMVETKKPLDRDPTIQEIMDILTQRARILEAVAPLAKTSTQPSGTQVTYKHQKPVHSFVVTNEIHNAACVYCNQTHSIFKCETFRNLSIDNRIQWVKSKKLCFNCFGTHHISKCNSKHSCLKCRRRHHTLLHISNYQSSSFSQSYKPNTTTSNCKPQEGPNHQQNALDSSNTISGTKAENIANPNLATDTYLTANSSNFQNSEFSPNSSSQPVLLFTALVWVKGDTGKRILCRAILDSASQSNFVTENICQKLGASKQSMHSTISGLSQTLSTSEYKTSLTIESRTQDYEAHLDFVILSKITPGKLPQQQINFNMNKIPNDIPLADPRFLLPDHVDMLIGAELYSYIFLGKPINICVELPPFSPTVFGYVVCGKPNISKSTTSISLFCCDIDLLRNDIRKFYQIEDVKTKNIFSLEEKSCENHYSTHVQRDGTGRYSVALPIKSNISKLGDNKQNSLKQFLNLERKFTTNPELKQLYCQFMEEYITLKHMQLVKDTTADLSYFIPHHAVFKESSSTSKIRVVFNASSKSATGLSLNDTLMTGPTIQQDLVSILLRFRKHRFALSADITKMYRQINIHPHHRNLQQIWWRRNQNDPLEIYQLNTVTYGTTSAPFKAIRTLKQLAIDEHQQFQTASQVLINDFYVDDVLTGSDNCQDTYVLKSQLTQLLAKGGFSLTKWASNIKIFNQDQMQIDHRIVNILGMTWNTEDDIIKISIGKFKNYTMSNKRSILSQISQLFDPLGLCGPVIFKAKLIMQKLWSIPNLNWDDELTDPYHTDWLQYSKEIQLLEKICIPRSLISSDHVKEIELHGFGDASQSGYGCCIYIRILDQNNIYHCNLLCAKSRVAPLKIQTIPRLELCAALLLGQLYEIVQKAIQIKFNKITLWSDSEITLFRINSAPSKYATFVANRVSQIQDIVPPSTWTYIPSEQNPADLISRGLWPSELQKCDLWWHGPEFLLHPDNSWNLPPTKSNTYEDTELAMTKPTPIKTFISVVVPNDLINRYSNFQKLLRISGLCLRFIKNCKLPIKNRKIDQLSPSDIDDACKGLIKSVQLQVFSADLKQLHSGKPICNRSSISKLNPFIDTTGLLRVGGRLDNALLPFDQKYPILLPSNHTFSTLLVRYEHSKNLHVGPQALLYSVRQRFWIVGGRKLCRKIVHECIACFKNKPIMMHQIMGQLPEKRVRPSRAFENVGIDYCGPFNVSYKIRSNVVSKAYVAVFICFTTKATHFEVVQELSTNAFLSMFRRFVSRRGRPTNIFSDNATNFIGARSELLHLKKLVTSDLHQNEILKYCTDEGICWKTIPARSPHFAGLWEAAIKSAKYHIKRTLGTIRCTYEELTTLITQIEACLNSRPISSMSNDPSDLSALTPGHFLIGGPLNSLPDPNLSHLSFNRLNRYQQLQHNLQLFWKRWSNEYLNELQNRQKWINPKQNLEVGSLVLLKQDNVPPMKWVMGRVIKTHPGADGFVRVATIKTLMGTFKRAVTQLSLLPVDDADSEN